MEDAEVTGKTEEDGDCMNLYRKEWRKTKPMMMYNHSVKAHGTKERNIVEFRLLQTR